MMPYARHSCITATGSPQANVEQMLLDLAPSPACIGNTSALRLEQLHPPERGVFACERPSQSAASAEQRWDHYRAVGPRLLRRASQPLAPSQVGIGMLLRSLPDRFLNDTSAARRDWMVGQFELVLLLDCNLDGGNATNEIDQIHTPAPPNALLQPQDKDGGRAAVHVRCFGGRKLRPPLYFYSSFKTGVLLRAMLELMPSKQFYLKIDSDTVLLPRNLISFLTVLHRRVHPNSPVYFGSSYAGGNYTRWSEGSRTLSFKSVNEIAWIRTRDLGRLANLSRTQQMSRSNVRERKKVTSLRLRETRWWRYLQDAMGLSPAEGRLSNATPEVRYSAGGAYGMNRAALHGVVQTNCTFRLGKIRYKGRRSRVHTIEDAAVGLCMHLVRARFVECPCFRQGHLSSPSNANGGLEQLLQRLLQVRLNGQQRLAMGAIDWVTSRARAAAEPLLCPNPITLHPIKVALQQELWAQLLTPGGSEHPAPRRGA